MSEEPVTGLGVVHNWMCDAMGHMNARHYMAMFDDASFQLLGIIAGRDLPAGVGWADIRAEIEYKAEAHAGTLLTIHSHVERVGNSSLAYMHVMRNSQDQRVHASCRVTSVHFDLANRTSIPLPDMMRRKAMSLLPATDVD